MKSSRALTIALTALLLILNGTLFAAGDANLPEGKVYKYKDGKHGDIEVHFPKGHDPAKAKVPAILMFHGGAWRRGNRKDFRYLCDYFASRGLVAASANYALTSKKEMNKAVCITGAKSAIRWYKQHAKELGIDPDRIIVGGASAGGHIALMATTTPLLDDPNDPKDVDTKAAAYILFCPALHGKDKKRKGTYFMDSISEDLPPMLVMFGDKDSWKGRLWDKAYAELKKKGKTDVEYLLAPGEGHTFFQNQPWVDLTLIAADKFLVKHGFLKGEPTRQPPKTDKALAPAK